MKNKKSSDQKKLVTQLSAIVAKAEKLVTAAGQVTKKKVKAVAKKPAKKSTPKKKPAKKAKR
jgi:hypothetical protein